MVYPSRSKYTLQTALLISKLKQPNAGKQPAEHNHGNGRYQQKAQDPFRSPGACTHCVFDLFIKIAEHGVISVLVSLLCSGPAYLPAFSSHQTGLPFAKKTFADCLNDLPIRVLVNDFTSSQGFEMSEIGNFRRARLHNDTWYLRSLFE